MTSVTTMAILTLMNHLLSVHLDLVLRILSDESVPDVEEEGEKRSSPSVPGIY